MNKKLSLVFLVCAVSAICQASQALEVRPERVGKYAQEQRAIVNQLKGFFACKNDDDIERLVPALESALIDPLIHPDDIGEFPGQLLDFYLDYPQVVAALLFKGANPNFHFTSNGKSVKALPRLLSTAQMLLAAGWDVQRLNEQDRFKLLRLRYGCDPKLPLALFKSGLKIDEAYDENGQSPLIAEFMQGIDVTGRYRLDDERWQKYESWAKTLIALGSLPVIRDSESSLDQICDGAVWGINQKNENPNYNQKALESEKQRLIAFKEIIKQAQSEVETAKKLRYAQLPNLLKTCGYFCNDTAKLVEGYAQDPNDHIVPLPIVKELDKLEDPLMAKKGRLGCLTKELNSVLDEGCASLVLAYDDQDDPIFSKSIWLQFEQEAQAAQRWERDREIAWKVGGESAPIITSYLEPEDNVTYFVERD